MPLGDAAVVRARYRQRGSIDGADRTGVFLLTDVYLLTRPEDYTDEAERYRRLILDACPVARTLLELGAGGGNNASHLKAHFTCTLADVSPQMLTVSRRLNPECEHVLGDMRTMRLGRTFDAVFVQMPAVF